MLDLLPSHLQMVRDILRKNVPGLPVWVFGSRATGKAKPYSDLDLAIFSDKPLTFAVLGRLGEDFSESDLPFRVDIVDWANANEEFKAVIATNHVEVTA